MDEKDEKDLHVLGLDHPRLGINEAGIGVTTSDWRIGFIPATGTDSRYDLEQEKERAERQDDDANEARKRGEKAPDPVGDLWRKEVLHQQGGAAADSPADQAIDSIQKQIAEQSGKIVPA